MAGRTYKSEAVVLRSFRFGEADRVLHLYTLDRGRVGALAKGNVPASIAATTAAAAHHPLSIYPLPARPPMMNVLCASVMAQTTDNFVAFQIVSVLLNVLAFLPCCLFLRRWRSRGGFAVG